MDNSQQSSQNSFLGRLKERIYRSLILHPKFASFIPKSITSILEGYSRSDFSSDLIAGMTVGVIALPLAMAFAIGSGVDPERGIYTAIIAGFIISLLGGSRFQIGGPTGAYVILLFTIVQKHGYEGLATATFTASILLMLFGLFRCGILIRFIPHPVIVGFTVGIGTVIIINQIKDFCGLTIPSPASDPIDRLHQYANAYSTFDWITFFIASITLYAIIRIRQYSKKIPAPIIALILATTLVWLLNLPLETIYSKFGTIPSCLPQPSWPNLSFELIRKTFPDGVSIALLGAIESLLSCVIADSLTGTRHLSNCELVAQGVGNFGSVLFGGIPATGAIARTTANIQMQAKSPISGMIHAVTLFLLMVLLAPIASLMPLAGLSAVLIFVAWNMLEINHVKSICKGPKSDSLVMILTFLVTVCVDLTAAVQVGVLLSLIMFIKKMSDSTSGRIWSLLEKEEEQPSFSYEERTLQELPENIPDSIQVFEIEGPFFFAVSDLLNELYERVPKKPQAIILRLRSVPLIDASGLHALERFSHRLATLDVQFYLCEAKPTIASTILKLKFPSSNSVQFIEKPLQQVLGYLQSCLLAAPSESGV